MRLPLPGLLLFALWIAGEIVLFNLVAGWTGGGLAFFLLVMKSVLGLVFVKRVLTRKLFDMLRRGGIVALGGAAATDAWLKGLGAALLVAPGFLTGIGGLALLTPSVRRWLVARSGAKPVNPRDIQLTAEEWREVSGDPKRIRRRTIDAE